MNEVRTRIKTAAVVDALREMQDEADTLYHHQALRDVIVKAEEAHACALDDTEESDRYERYAKMMATAKEYYTLLEEGKESSVELKDKLDTLLEPFSDDPAFTVFCQMKRAAAGLS